MKCKNCGHRIKEYPDDKVYPYLHDNPDDRTLNGINCFALKGGRGKNKDCFCLNPEPEEL